MTDYTKGGRGKRAPYQTVVVRVPEPLADTVNEMVETYRTNGEIKPVTSLETETQNTLNPEAVRILEEALTLKANAGGKIKDAIRQALELMNS